MIKSKKKTGVKTVSQYAYTAFISYRHKLPDEAIAKKLHSFIENYSIPKDVKASSGRRKMGRVFRDQEELPLSTDLGGDIKAALDSSEWLIAVCSKDYLESKWCMTEMDYFISIGRRDHILAILAEGEPETSFPRQLRFVERGGETVELEPLAGDVRGETLSESLKKLGREKLRILAPILGVSYDTLRQRARRKRIRTAIAAAAVAIALLGGFLTYALVKNAQITAQNEQIMLQNEEISRQNEEIAEQRDIALNNQMQVLIEQANISVSGENKLPAQRILAEASDLRETVGEVNDAALYSALEASLYTGSFETIQTIDNDNRRFNSIVFSHDDRYLLGITNINSATLIDAESGKLMYSVSRSDVGMLDSVGFTKDDKYFFTVDSWYGYVSLYKTATGELYRQFDAADGRAWNIGEKVFAMEGGKILVPTRTELFIWDYEADDGEGVLPIDMSTMESYIQPFMVDLSPDGSCIAEGSPGYGVGLKIRSLDGKREIALENDSERGYFPIMFSGNGKYVAASSMNVYSVWNAETGRLVLNGAVSAAGFDVGSVVINYDGSVLLFMTSQYLCAIEVKSGRTLWEITAESNVVTEAAVSPNGKYVCAYGGISGVFDIKTGERLSDRPCSAFSNDGTKVLSDTFGSDPAVLITPEAATAKIVGGYKGELFTTPRYTDPPAFIGLSLKHSAGDFYTTFPGNVNRKSAVYIDPETRYAACTHYDGFIEVFDISDTDNIKDAYCIAEHCYNSVEDVVFSGSLMASCGGFDPRCAVFDLESGTMLHVLRGEGYAYKSEFSPDGSKIMLLCGRGSDVVLVYSVQTGNLLYRIEAPGDLSFTEIGFSPDGEKAVALLSDGRAAVGEIYGTLGELIKLTREAK